MLMLIFFISTSTCFSPFYRLFLFHFLLLYFGYYSNVTHLSLTWMVTGIAALGALKQRGTYAALIDDTTLVPMLITLACLGLIVGSFFVGAIIPCCFNQRWPLYEYCNDHNMSWGANTMDPSQGDADLIFHTDGIEFVAPERHHNRCYRPFVSCYHRIYQHHRLFVGRYDKYSHVRQWMIDIGVCQDLLLECQFIEKEFLPLKRMNEVVQVLRADWLKALTRNHILMYSLRDYLEEIIAIRNGLAKTHSLYARKELGLTELDVLHFSDLVNNRDRDRVLMDPRIRCALRKLVAMRMWIGDRHIETLEIKDNDHPFHLVPGPADILQSLTNQSEKDLFYVISFRGGPLYLDIAPGAKDEIEIDGFISPSNGKPGPAEVSGIIEYGDLVVAVNGTSLTSLTFDDSLDIFADATWPRMIVFQRPMDGVKQKRSAEILDAYLNLQRSLMTAAAPEENSTGTENQNEASNGTITTSTSTTNEENAGGETKSHMPTWKDMLHAHTNDNMSLDETLEAIQLMEHAAMSHESVDQLEERLSFFIKKWEEDFSNHHDGKVLTDEDRMEIKDWYHSMNVVRQRLRELVEEEAK